MIGETIRERAHRIFMARRARLERAQERVKQANTPARARWRRRREQAALDLKDVRYLESLRKARIL